MKKAPEGSILILYVLRVTPDPNKGEEFVVEYVLEDDELEQTQQLHLVCKERSREYWVESLSVFINHLRKIKQDVKHKGEGDGSGSASTRVMKSERGKSHPSKKEQHSSSSSEDHPPTKAT